MEAGVQGAGKDRLLRGLCGRESGEEGPRLTLEMACSWDGRTWTWRGDSVSSTWVVTSAAGERQEIDCLHLERLENSPGLRRLGGKPAGLHVEKGGGLPDSPSPLSSLPSQAFSPLRETAPGPGKTLTWEAGDFILVTGSQLPVV